MNALKLFRNLVFPHLWLTHFIDPVTLSALITGGGALLGGIFGSGGDEGQDPISNFVLQHPVFKGTAKDAIREAQGFGDKEFFPGDTVADLTPEQLQGLQGQLDFAGGLQPTVDNIFGSFNQGINPDTVNDPAVQAMLDSIQSRGNQNLFENLVPGLRRGGTGAGQGFGTRPELAAGVAASRTNRDILDAQGTFLGNQLASARGLQGQLLGQSSGILGTGLLPGQIQQQVGGVFQNQDQLGIQEAIDRFNFEQNAPGQRIDDLLARNQLASSLGGGGAFLPSQNTGVSTISGALAGAAAGNAFASSFPDLFNAPSGGSLTSYQPNFGGQPQTGSLFGNTPALNINF